MDYAIEVLERDRISLSKERERITILFTHPCFSDETTLALKIIDLRITDLVNKISILTYNEL